MSTQQLNAYARLAPLYDDLGFSDYAEAITPQLLTFLQENGWLGRRILELGCGTGVSTSFFASVGMETTGIDLSPQMLEVAQKRQEDTGYHADFIQGDIRQVEFPGAMDLVICIGNVFNEFMSMREIKAVMEKAFKALEPGRSFVFDMTTLRGLGEYIGSSEQIIEVSEHLFLAVKNRFTFDNMTTRQAVNIFYQGQDGNWGRLNINLALRSYPHDGILKLLTDTGFTVIGSYTTGFEEFDALNDSEGRVIVIAEKPA
jgi:2-polyprenyl-3-methyl-5-hydroxy-6-metoxy-1,4-benzoquinol methylase